MNDKLDYLLCIIICGFISLPLLTILSASAQLTSPSDIITTSNQVITYNEISQLDLTQITDGSQIKNAIINISINGWPIKLCHIKLKDPILNSITISDKFPCYGQQSISLNKLGIDALQNNLQTNLLDIQIQDESSSFIPSSSITLTTTYDQPTNYAQIVNGVVVNVIVADQNFINSQPGTWKQSNIAGIGYTYDKTHDLIIPPTTNSSNPSLNNTTTKGVNQ